MSAKLDTLTHALAYIETRLDGELTPQQVADACHYSLSGLQRLFSHGFHMGLADYIGRRRVTRAARDLLETEDSVLAIALRYGYGSHEVFIRAFRRIWGETTSHFRRSRSFSDVYPPYIVSQGGDRMLTRKPDPTQLYDAIRAMDGAIAIVFDVSHLTPINEQYGTAAGDLVIAECVRRIDAVKRDGMLMFRLGGDEFILLTGLDDEQAAQAIVDEALAQNGQPIQWNGHAIPTSLHYAVTRLDAGADHQGGQTLRDLIQ